MSLIFSQKDQKRSTKRSVTQELEDFLKRHTQAIKNKLDSKNEKLNTNIGV